MILQESARVQPILVILVWRGSDRFRRCLNSIQHCEKYFSRIILSITSEPDSEDVEIAKQYISDRQNSGNPSKAEIFCTEREFPTMTHQELWIDYAIATGASPDNWILWLAYDDELRVTGLEEIVSSGMGWPLSSGYTYFGPWGVRHENAHALWAGDPREPIDVWTSFPQEGPLELSSISWVSQQLIQPTYMQMSGSLAQLRNHRNLVKRWPRKSGPMRIEMATAMLSPRVMELPVPIVTIYGRANSDRANYSHMTRREDVHLALLSLRVILLRPRLWKEAALSTFRILRHLTSRILSGNWELQEEWRVREHQAEA